MSAAHDSAHDPVHDAAYELAAADAAQRPAAPLFPVEAPYRMRADLTRLDGSAFPVGADDDALRAEKARGLRQRPERVRVPDPERGLDAVGADVAATLPRISEARPDAIVPASAADARTAWPVTVADALGRAWAFPRLGREARDLLEASPPETRVADALALSLPDDLAWMRADDAAGRATLLHVSFPSHWAPDARAGASLAELHGPVADGEALRAASAALMRAIVRKGPFRRSVWSLQSTAALDLHPRSEHSAGPLGTHDAGARDVVGRSWFRVERQTTVPFPAAGLALFAIRVHVTPLSRVLAARPGRAARLAASIHSMSAGVRLYKGLGDADGLLEELLGWDARADRSA